MLRIVVAVVVSVVVGGCDNGEVARVHVMSGTAYTFNTPDPVEGAVIRVVEHPELETVSAADGSWSLEVPEGEVTLYAAHAAHTTMHLQTFDLKAPLERVYFQMVRTEIFAALATILGITPNPERCQLASTVSEKAIQTMTFAEFAAHGAHGVAGATATLRPGGLAPVYFNENVIPDAARTETSDDGGVVWANIPPGRYTVTVEHPDKDFAEAVIVCEPGRFINANPPHGLREL